MSLVRKPFVLLILLGALWVATAAQPAFAAPSPVIADCNSHGQLTQRYSVTQLHTALATMPPEVQEYTDCYNVIQNALEAQVAGHRVDPSNSSGRGGGLSTPLLIVIILLVVGGGVLGGVAMQRRGGTPGSS